MEIEWNRTEVLALLDAQRASDDDREQCFMVARCAIELFLARASGQVKEDAEELRDTIACAKLAPSTKAEDQRRLSRLAARAQQSDMAVAAHQQAEQEVDALRAQLAERETLLAGHREREATYQQALESLRAEVGRLEADVERQYKALETCQRQLDDRGLLERRADTAESRLAAIRTLILEHEATPHQDPAVALTQIGDLFHDDAPKEYDGPGPEDMLEGDAPHGPGPTSREIVDSWARGDVPQKATDERVYPCICDFMVSACAAKRHPCSATCTHDDAATPGHPERVGTHSEKMIAAAAALGDTASGLRELRETQNQERLEPEHAHGDRLREPAPDGPWLAQSGEEQASEAEDAMQAACIEAALVWAQSEGLSMEQQSNLKKAIEGTAP